MAVGTSSFRGLKSPSWELEEGNKLYKTKLGCTAIGDLPLGSMSGVNTSVGVSFFCDLAELGRGKNS